MRKQTFMGLDDQPDEIRLIIPIPPQVRRPPRVTKFGTHRDSKDLMYETELRQFIEDHYHGPQMGGNISVEIHLGKEWIELIVRPSECPKVMRGDTDNYTKNILDAAQEQKEKRHPETGDLKKPYRRGLFKNDSRVTELHVYQTELVDVSDE